MSHAIQQIRDAVVVAVTGLTTSGSRVYPSRVYPLGDEHLPGLIVHTGDETVSRRGDRRVGYQVRELEVMVEARAKLAGGVDDLLDTMTAEIEIALAAGISVPVIRLDLVGRQVLMVPLEKPVGVAKIKFRARYLLDAGAPGTVIDGEP